jgi:opacity protein-like surface antigen
MSMLKACGFAGIMIASSLGIARAADMPPIMQQAPQEVSEFGSNWYLRGDIGYRANRISTTSTWGGLPLVPGTFEGATSLSGGVGFKVGWFRADLTYDYMTRANMQATALGFPNLSVKVGSQALLFNAYADLGTWNGFTPYVGLGVGASFVEISDYPSAAFTASAPESSARKGNLAWAAMAGVSYGLTSSLAVELGYRYINLGSGESGVNRDVMTLNLDGFSSHEVRLGARFMID